MPPRKRSFLEDVNVQFSEGFPGVVLEENKIYINRKAADIDARLEQLYTAYLNNDADFCAISPEYAKGLYYFLENTRRAPWAVKGQLTAPLTWGLTVVDEEDTAILHDEILGDAVPKMLRLKAMWMERWLRPIR